ncbi:MAG: TrkA C-terminal domain-containing protein [Candidatus Bathyarchaeia archaeon]
MIGFEKIEYKPIPVRELLLEMKNLSELMIDLAYSAALFNDRDLAEDVLELERRVDTLAYQLDMTIMIAARDAREAEMLTGVSTVAAAADKISDAAADIAVIVTQNIGVHPIFTEIFEKVEERIIQAVVSENSVFVGKQIGELDLAAKMGVDIIAIRRNKDWIINPKDTECIQKGDVLIARGAPTGVKEFKVLAEGKPLETEV